ncbi:MAG: Copper-sensing transcriptional repressor CsoR [Pseudomonadota bacterium]|jgi:DNA-binding FrmR family transcriptional regulator
MVQSKRMASPKKTKAASLDSVATRPGYRLEYQRDVTNRLRRIHGQVGALLEMIDSGRSCEDVAQQMSAVRKAMDKAFYRMMTCSVMEAATVDGQERLREVERSARILERYA